MQCLGRHSALVLMIAGTAIHQLKDIHFGLQKLQITWHII
jgi:hypothetical protein